MHAGALRGACGCAATARCRTRPGLRLVQVGTATLRSSQLFGDFLAPTDNALADREVAPAAAAGRRVPPPAAGAARRRRGDRGAHPGAGGREHLPELRLGLAARGRAAAAVADRRPRRRGASRRGRPCPADSIGYSVQAPVEELRATERSATVAGRRLLLVGGEAAALLFAFAVLAARSMRRDLEAARRRLTWYGARRWQLRLLTGAESAAVALVGTVAGWLVGVAVGALAASRAGAPVGAVLRESVLSPAGLALAAGVVVLATRRRSRSRPPIRRRDESRFGAARRRGGRRDRDRRRGAPRRRRRRVAARRGPGRGPRAAPPARPDRVRGRRRGGAALRPVRAARRPAARPQRRRAPRGRHARPRPGRGSGHRGLPHARLRPRAARRGLPRDARPRRERPGVVRRAARRRRARGSEVARPRARRCAARAVCRAWREASTRSPVAPAPGQRRERRGDQRDHRARSARRETIARVHGWRDDFSDRLAGLARRGGDAAGAGRRSQGVRLGSRLALRRRPGRSCRSSRRSRRPTGATRPVELGPLAPTRRDARRSSPCRRGCRAARSSRSSSCRRD